MISSIPTPTPMCEILSCRLPAKQGCLQCKKVFYCSGEHQELDFEDHQKSCKVFKKVAEKARLRHSPQSLNGRVSFPTEAKHTPKKISKPLKMKSVKPINRTKKESLDRLTKQVKALNTLSGQGEVTVYHEGKEYIVVFDALKENTYIGDKHFDTNILVFTETEYSREVIGEIKKCFPEEFTCIIASKKAK